MKWSYNGINIELTSEQTIFLQDAIHGHNVLVDACVGSGKTTAIQALCDAMPKYKKILYLTYSRLLKIDAQSKIKNKNVTVQNYHGFAYRYAKVAPAEQIKNFLSMKPKIDHYDIMILDEYQDIDQEISDMLVYIKEKLPKLQIVAVGDMQQKIADRTTLDINEFMKDFLGKDRMQRAFTTCFRLNKAHAEMLGRIWNKPILGANYSGVVEYLTYDEVFNLLLDYEPSDILCLGSRTGSMSKMLNDLEDSASYKFNKNTVYASIRDKDGQQVGFGNDVSIFTTFDSCKGLERKICVVFDFDKNYWDRRLNKPDQSYEILRNIFCVAASRGKDRIIFVKGNKEMLDEKMLMLPKDKSLDTMDDYTISDMFDFKYAEDIDNCMKHIDIMEVSHNGEMRLLDIKRADGLIDLSPCVGIFQEAHFFEKYSIDTAIRNHLSTKNATDKEKSLYNRSYKRKSLEDKVLFLTSLETKQERYRTQVGVPFITDDEKQQITVRLSTHFSSKDTVQVECRLPFFLSSYDSNSSGELNCPYFHIIGLADVVKSKAVYELKFVSHVDKVHYLQLACYIAALGLKKGRLINVLDNKVYDVAILDKPSFLESVAHTITKRRFSGFKIITGARASKKIQKHMDEVKREKRSDAQHERWEKKWREEKEATLQKQREEHQQRMIEMREQRRMESLKQQREPINAVKFELKKYTEEVNMDALPFALIDVETSFAGDVISIGVVISDDVSFKPRDFKYYRISEHENAHAMYAHALELEDFVFNPSEYEIKSTYHKTLGDIKQLLAAYGVKHLFAYNANFDKRQLPELGAYRWYDIIEKAAYKQFNKKIPNSSEFWGTGRLKRGYGVESIYRILSENDGYIETHNALIDALDELKIMEFLKYSLKNYSSI